MTRFCTTGLSRRRQAARPSHPRVPGGHDFYPHRLVPCPRLPAAALNQRYGPTAALCCIFPVPAPQSKFPVFRPPGGTPLPCLGRAKLLLSRRLTRIVSPRSRPRRLSSPPLNQPASPPPDLPPASEKLRRSHSTGSRSGPENRGLSGLWVCGFPPAACFPMTKASHPL
jgi:hypothetical protein